MNAPADAALEARIEITTLRLHTATTPKQRRAHWAELTALIAQRSQEQVARMERSKGLAR